MSYTIRTYADVLPGMTLLTSNGEVRIEGVSRSRKTGVHRLYVSRLGRLAFEGPAAQKVSVKDGPLRLSTAGGEHGHGSTFWLEQKGGPVGQRLLHLSVGSLASYHERNGEPAPAEGDDQLWLQETSSCIHGDEWVEKDAHVAPGEVFEVLGWGQFSVAFGRLGQVEVTPADEASAARWAASNDARRRDDARRAKELAERRAAEAAAWEARKATEAAAPKAARKGRKARGS